MLNKTYYILFFCLITTSALHAQEQNCKWTRWNGVVVSAPAGFGVTNVSCEHSCSPDFKLK